MVKQKTLKCIPMQWNVKVLKGLSITVTQVHQKKATSSITFPTFSLVHPLAKKKSTSIGQLVQILMLWVHKSLQNIEGRKWMRRREAKGNLLYLSFAFSFSKNITLVFLFGSCRPFNAFPQSKWLCKDFCSTRATGPRGRKSSVIKQIVMTFTMLNTTVNFSIGW